MELTPATATLENAQIVARAAGFEFAAATMEEAIEGLRAQMSEGVFLHFTSLPKAADVAAAQAEVAQTASITTLTPADSEFYPTFGPAITNKDIRKATGSRMTVKDADRWTALRENGVVTGFVALRGKNSTTAEITAAWGEDEAAKRAALVPALNDARTAGFKRVQVQVRVENIAWYAALGFEAFGPVAYGFQAVRIAL